MEGANEPGRDEQIMFFNSVLKHLMPVDVRATGR